MIKQTNNPMKRFVTALAMFIAPTLALATTSKDMTGEARDAFREGQIWATYVANPALDGYTLDVDVNGNKAVLTGTVESAIQKTLAEQVALRTEGIDSVDNRIKLDPLLVVTVVDTKPGFGDFVADATISAMVDSKLLWNDYTDGLDIDVSSQFGVVTLTGEADTPHSKALAANLALHTPGVIAVKNMLRVNKTDGEVAVVDDGDGKLSDDWIAAKVDSSLLWTTGVDSYEIDVNANDGVVTLRGTVDSDYEKELAIDVAQNVRGIKRVDASGLTVEGEGIDERVSQR